MVLGLNRLALAEGLLFGLRQGLDGPALLAVLKDSAAYSRAMDIKLLLAGVAAGWSERDNSSIMAVLRSLIERPGSPPDPAAPS